MSYLFFLFRARAVSTLSEESHTVEADNAIDNTKKMSFLLSRWRQSSVNAVRSANKVLLANSSLALSTTSNSASSAISMSNNGSLSSHAGIICEYKTLNFIKIVCGDRQIATNGEEAHMMNISVQMATGIAAADGLTVQTRVTRSILILSRCISCCWKEYDKSRSSSSLHFIAPATTISPSTTPAT